MLLQVALWCGCGEMLVGSDGRCARCHRRKRLSDDNFGGLREAVLARDGCCRACGEIEDLVVHHRRPGVNLMRWLITLCRGCHTRVHHTSRPRYGAMSLELRALWREANRALAEQRELVLHMGPELRPAPKHQPFLFEPSSDTRPAENPRFLAHAPA